MDNTVSSSFDKSTDAEDVIKALKVDLTNKNVIITGGNSGIGKEVARVLALAHANVFIACRDKKKGEEAVADITQENSAAVVKVLGLDLNSFASIEDFGKSWRALGKPLHLLINNAGVNSLQPVLNADGFEPQYATNHLGHFLLTNLLVDSLKAAGKARVVSVASDTHALVPFELKAAGTLDVFKLGRFYFPGRFMAYAHSKSANILFAVELDRRFKDSRINAEAFSANPSLVVDTNLARNVVTPGSLPASILKSVMGLFSKTIPQGAATIVVAAVSPVLEGKGGVYVDHCQITPAAPYAADVETAKKLWELSAKQCRLEEKRRDAANKL